MLKNDSSDEHRVVKARQEGPEFLKVGSHKPPGGEISSCMVAQTRKIIHMEFSSPKIKLDHLFCSTSL